MKKITGNFLIQPNKDFPIDCESFDYLQGNIAMVEIIGNIAGDKAILSGCEEQLGGAERKEGYVFLRTDAHKEGEILFWEGGSISSGAYIKEEAIGFSSEGYDYPKAYTVRSLAPGVGGENYNLAEFKPIKTNQQLDDYSKKQDADIARLTPPPIGIIQMWAGKTTPLNYLRCNGSELLIIDYPELYESIGTSFYPLLNSEGKPFTPPPGYFKLPDLRGRFVTGYDGAEYNKLGATGGERKHILIPDEMPSHTHSFKDYYFAENSKTVQSGASGVDFFKGWGVTGAKGNDNDNDSLPFFNHNTYAAGSGLSHENRPPYCVLDYIMRVK